MRCPPAWQATEGYAMADGRGGSVTFPARTPPARTPRGRARPNRNPPEPMNDSRTSDAFLDREDLHAAQSELRRQMRIPRATLAWAEPEAGSRAPGWDERRAETERASESRTR